MPPPTPLAELPSIAPLPLSVLYPPFWHHPSPISLKMLTFRIAAIEWYVHFSPHVLPVWVALNKNIRFCFAGLAFLSLL